MIKPKRMFVLCKGDSFYKVQSKDKKPTKRMIKFKKKRTNFSRNLSSSLFRKTNLEIVY